MELMKVESLAAWWVVHLVEQTEILTAASSVALKAV
jgi:hypothetical protein